MTKNLITTYQIFYKKLHPGQLVRTRGLIHVIQNFASFKEYREQRSEGMPFMENVYPGTIMLYLGQEPGEADEDDYLSKKYPLMRWVYKERIVWAVFLENDVELL